MVRGGVSSKEATPGGREQGTAPDRILGGKGLEHFLQGAEEPKLA